MNKMNKTNISTGLVTRETRQQQVLTYRGFSAAIIGPMANINVSHQTVMNWEKECTEPPTDFLLLCLVIHIGWQREWAIRCLCAKLPEVFSLADDGRLIVLSNRVIAGSLHPAV